MLNKFLLSKIFLVFLIFIIWTQPASAQVDQSDIINALQNQISQLLVQIQSLEKQINQFQTELGVGTALATTPIVFPEFTRFLSFGARGNDVENLQKLLAQDKEIYSEGLITGYFGPLTEKAVQRWQKKQGIVSFGSAEMTGYGRVGPETKSQLNKLITEGAGASGVIPPGLITAPGIQKKFEEATTTPIATTTAQTLTCAQDPAYCLNQADCASYGFYWYTVSCHNTPAPSY